ncbi:hypothetical protein HAX54_023005, partial [Datura stramonium]|nr:hypothetical protein [Datura stramonium]
MEDFALWKRRDSLALAPTFRRCRCAVHRCITKSRKSLFNSFCIVPADRRCQLSSCRSLTSKLLVPSMSYLRDT